MHGPGCVDLRRSCWFVFQAQAQRGGEVEAVRDVLSHHVMGAPEDQVRGDGSGAERSGFGGLGASAAVAGRCGGDGSMAVPLAYEVRAEPRNVI